MGFIKAFEIRVVTDSTSQYVRDAVRYVNGEICAAGCSTAFNDRELGSYISFAEDRILECLEEWQKEMRVEITEIDYEIEDDDDDDDE